MKKLLILMTILLVALAGCNFLPINQNGNTNQSMNNTMNLDMDKNTSSDLDKTKNTTTKTEEEKAKEEKTEKENTTTDITTNNLPTKTIKEGEKVEFKKDLAYDPDGDQLTYEFSSPLNLDGTWQTQLGDAGTYIITVSVTDGKLNSEQKIKLIVEAINNLPVIDNFQNINVKEGDLIKLNPEITDEDQDPIKLSYSGFMTTNTYQTTFDDAGTYTVTLTADDGKQKATKSIQIIIDNTNRAPKLEGLNSLALTEGETAKITPTISDPDGDALSLTFGKPLNQEGVWKTSEGDAGKYDIEISVSDGELTTKDTVEILVKSSNNIPTLEVPEKITVNEGDLIKLNPEINDEDGDPLKVTYGGFMTTNSYQTTFDDAGEYQTTISVSDGKDTVSKTIEIVIEDTNRAPVFNTDWFE